MNFFSERHGGTSQFVTYYHAVTISEPKKEGLVCKLLDIKPATLKRYLSGASEPPAPLVRLLYHESHIGRAEIDAHTHQGMVYQLHVAQDLGRDVARLQAVILALETENTEIKLNATQGNDFAANSCRYRA